MNYQEETEQSRQFFAECHDLLLKKANDYAQDADVFSNFKKIASTCEVPVEKTFIMFMEVKLARLMELIKKEAKNESMGDSLKDIANYACLMALYITEERRVQ